MPCDPAPIRASRAFRSALSDPSLGRILDVHDFDPSPAIEKIDRPVVVVSCYSDRSRQIGTIFRDFVLLIQNSYMLGFVHDLAGAWLHHHHREELDLIPFEQGFAKKFVGEQLYRRGPSAIARILFLESVLAFERTWRVPIEARETDRAMKQSVDSLSRIASHFMLHHELGHIAVADERFHPFIRERVALYLDNHDTSDVPLHAREALREEAEADLFGISCSIAEFAPVLTEEHLRSYLTFAVRALTALNVLYGMADDLHRENVDATFEIDVEEAFALWRHRELLMTAYIDSLPLDSTTVEAAPADDLLDLPDAGELFAGLLDPGKIVGAVSEDTRRFLHVVDLGFAEGGSFDDVIQRTRVQWVLGAD